MRIVRATHRKYAVQDPRGAMAVFGRWHHRGQPVLYCSSSLAMAVLEQRAHSVTFPEIRADFHYADIDLADVRIENVPENHFEIDWRMEIRRTQEFGTEWLKSLRSAVLQVRSAVLAVEMNYLLNPMHPDFDKVRFSEPKPIPLDEHL